MVSIDRRESGGAGVGLGNVPARTAVAFSAAVLAGASGVAVSGDSVDDAWRLEAQGLVVLHALHIFERDLMSADTGRLSVFVSLPPGAAVVLDEAVLFVDGQPVARHKYAPVELSRLAEGAVQPLYAGTLAPGEHQLRLDVKTRAGRVLPMQAVPLVKGERARVVELQIAGEPVRQVKVRAW